jgi:hypothetical protein
MTSFRRSEHRVLTSTLMLAALAVALSWLAWLRFRRRACAG